jgi:hypothetical protein
MTSSGTRCIFDFFIVQGRTKLKLKPLNEIPKAQETDINLDMHPRSRRRGYEFNPATKENLETIQYFQLSFRNCNIVASHREVR